jgi:hypothetical protein
MANKSINNSDADAQDDGDLISEFIPLVDYLSGAFYAVSALESLDPMTTEDKKFKADKLKKCYLIIGYCIDEFYDSILPE